MLRKCSDGGAAADERIIVLLVALAPVRDLFLCAKHLFVAAMVANCLWPEDQDEVQSHQRLRQRQRKRGAMQKIQGRGKAGAAS
jgi:hypothetical protein